MNFTEEQKYRLQGIAENIKIGSDISDANAQFLLELLKTAHFEAEENTAVLYAEWDNDVPEGVYLLAQEDKEWQQDFEDTWAFIENREAKTILKEEDDEEF